jgi:transposase, IS6 family
MQKEEVLPKDSKLRRVKFLNNIIKQDYRYCLGYRLFATSERTIQGIEAVNMMRKGQVKRLDRKDSIGQAKFVESLFGIAA